MPQEFINVGLGELTGDGETLRSAFIKVNKNFNEIFATATAKAEFGDTAPTDATDGSFYFSTTTGRLYIRYNGAWIEPQTVVDNTTGGSSSGGATTVISSSPPNLPVDGTFWLNKDNAKLYIYTDGQWVQPAITGGASFIQAESPLYEPQFEDHWDDPKPQTVAEALDRIVQVLYQITAQKV